MLNQSGRNHIEQKELMLVKINSKRLKQTKQIIKKVPYHYHRDYVVFCGAVPNLVSSYISEAYYPATVD